MSKKIEAEPRTQWEIRLVVTMAEGDNSLIDLRDNQNRKSKNDFCSDFSNILWNCREIVSFKVKESEIEHTTQHPR